MLKNTCVPNKHEFERPLYEINVVLILNSQVTLEDDRKVILKIMAAAKVFCMFLSLGRIHFSLSVNPIQSV